MSSLKTVDKIFLPDFISYCAIPKRVSPHEMQSTIETREWLIEFGVTGKKLDDVMDRFKSGLLTAMVYPGAPLPELRVCSDIVAWLFLLDDLSDVMDNGVTRTTSEDIMNSLYHTDTYTSPDLLGRVCRDVWKRFVLTASIGTRRRFIETMKDALHGVKEQNKNRIAGVIPDLDSYIALRRDVSGCAPSWVLIEYAYNLDIPDEVMEHPVISSLQEAANDFVSWTNDILSYNVERSNGQACNMVMVVMNQNNLDVQSAVDFVWPMCKEAFGRFMDLKRNEIPSWSPEVDDAVRIYIEGLVDWMIGALYWSFECERYLGKEAKKVKETLVVHLLQ